MIAISELEQLMQEPVFPIFIPNFNIFEMSYIWVVKYVEKFINHY